MANVHDRVVLLEAGMTADPTDPTGPPQPGLRRRPGIFRLSVRGLLVLVLVIGCLLGWITQVIRAGRAQHNAVAAIYQAGGWVVYDTEWDEHQTTSRWQPRWPRWVVDQVGADYAGNVVFVNLHDRGTDAVLAQVGRLTHLKQLHRLGRAVTDAGLAHLGRLNDLELLSLEGTQVTNIGLARLKGLKELKWLKLARTAVTDAGVQALQKALPQLKPVR